jgi:Tfp pilus assembly protein PilX
MTDTVYAVSGRRHGGIALPVVLVILVLMLIGGVYLLKSVHSTGLTTGNLAYDATLSRAADRGLLDGFQWLRTTAAANRTTLDQDDPAHGYHASTDISLTPRDTNFWGYKQVITENGTTIEYVIHRLCGQRGSYEGNDCTQTAANTAALGNTTPLGTSLATDTAQYAGAPRIHYVITSRISGGRGASVTNQMVVLIGA